MRRREGAPEVLQYRLPPSQAAIKTAARKFRAAAVLFDFI